MCDTMVDLGDPGKGRPTIFAKNSDRDPNEAQQLVSVPSSRNLAGTPLACTYISIPQVSRTHAVLLSKPFWMWGAEMGVNEYGVAIGNEAVFTRVSQRTTPALIGMDLVRLGLERAQDASEALDVIIALLERHGQGGNCGYSRDFRYDNSFLIADPSGAWVLETAGTTWAAKRVQGSYAISNGLTITTDWDIASHDMVDRAIDAGWYDGAQGFDFQAAYTDVERSSATNCEGRRARLLTVAESEDSSLPNAMRGLRDHGDTPLWQGSPLVPARKTVCMHSNVNANAISQTVGSLVTALYADGPLCFATGTSAPCTGIFKPVWPDVPVPGQEILPGKISNTDTLFWRHELLHRLSVLDDLAATAIDLREAEEIERRFIAEAGSVRTADAGIRAAYSQRWFQEAANVTDRWYDHARSRGNATRVAQSVYHEAWLRLNREAGLADDYGRSQM